MAGPDRRVYRTGHLGIALFVTATVGSLLVAAGAPSGALLTGLVLVSLATVPDVDHHLPLITHRGPTHSLLFAVLVGGALGGGGRLLIRFGGSNLSSLLLPLDGVFGLGIGRYGFLIGFLAIIAHLFGDVLTPAGVPLFWPAPTAYSLKLVQSDDLIRNYGLLVLGSVAVLGAVVLANLPRP